MRSPPLLLLVVLACSSNKRKEAPPTPAPRPASEVAEAPPPATPLIPLAADPGGATGNARWTLALGGAGVDAPRAVATEPGGAALLAGLFSGEATFGSLGARAAAGKTDAVVVRVDERGAPSWVVPIGGAGEDVANGVAILGDRILAVGSFSDKIAIASSDGDAPLVSKAEGSDDLFAACLDRRGVPQWLWRAGGRDSDGANTVAAVADGWIIGGSFSGTAQFGATELVSRGRTDAVLLKLDTDGNLVWIKQFGGRYADAIWRVAADPAGDLLVQGVFADVSEWGGGPLKAGGGSDNDVVLAKYDHAGNHRWSQRFGNAFNEVAGGLAVDPAGFVTMTGSFDLKIDFGDGEVSSLGESDIFVARFAPDGKLVWKHTFGDKREDIGFGVAADAAGNVVVSGWFEGTVDFGGGPRTSSGNRDVFLLKLAPDGRHVWSTSFGARDHDQARALAMDDQARPVLAGIFRFDVAVAPSASELHSTRAPDDKAPPPDIFLAAFER
ncbi:MAG: hypothetical protein R3B48_11140 [Kofleriaceae bacterium]